MNLTGIDYLDYTWNPLAMRCTRVSPACDNCWHLRMAARKAGNPKLTDLERRASAGLIPPVLMPDRLDEPSHLKKPRRIGVQFMGDLFHEAVTIGQLTHILDIIDSCPQHTFLILTKRPERISPMLYGKHGSSVDPTNKTWRYLAKGSFFPNLWLGITAENQAWFDRRWADLKQIPAAKVIVSYEPALGPIVFPEDFLARGNDAWLIPGGETGPHARHSHPDWFRRARDQAVAAGVPFFFKSWGEWMPAEFNLPLESPPKNQFNWPDGLVSFHVGKKAAGRSLDGRTWDEVPNV